MTVTTSQGRTINIHFMHSSPGADSDPNFKARVDATAERVSLDDDAKFAERRLTLCTVSEVRYSGGSDEASTEDYIVLGEGLAQCHPKDSFSKAKGRKQSLQYALLAAYPSKELVPDLDNDALFDNYSQRDAIWQAYLVQSGIKKAA